MDSLWGAVFKGKLEPGTGDVFKISYEFDNTPLDGAMPKEVKRQRMIMQLPYAADVVCVNATVSIAALGIDKEDVIISCEPPDGKDGGRRLLLQSIKKPEMGVTMLRLASSGDKIIGGEEDWTPDKPSIISVKRKDDAAKPPPSRSRPNLSPPPAERMSQTGYPPPAEALQPTADENMEPTVVLQGLKPTKPSAPPPSNARRVQPVSLKEGGSADGSAGKEATAEKIRPSSPLRQLYPDPYADRADEDEEDGWAPQPGEREETLQGWAFSRSQAQAAPSEKIEGGIGRLNQSRVAQKVQPAPKKPPAGPAADVTDGMRPDSLLGAPKGDGDGAGGALPPEAAAINDAVIRLVAAAANGETGDMRMMIARIGTDRLAPSDSKHEGMSALMAAAENGRDDAIDLLIEKKADLEVVDVRGWTAVMHAVMAQRPATLKRLLDAKANPKHESGAAGDGLTPLMMAASGARPELVGHLLKAGSIKETQDAEGRRATHHAAKGGRGGAMAALLAAKAKLEAPDKFGNTPLMVAAAAGRNSIVNMLLSANADKDAKDVEGRTASDLADAQGHYQVVRILAGEEI
eukprot:TRINITY_DN41651_c0_g2_i1.p1 TRINITY_DN41651_c0_g2~~TRINITY_DN41651_c0_g2_i1.p1  ORF type:complete len:576 (-),score=138.54 TRINITY_DN41651_c0_g2_i1:222-1949(-)